MKIGPLQIEEEVLRQFCVKHQIVLLEVFGSVIRDDFGPDSDVDLLATFAPEARPSYFDLLRAEEELGKILGRKVEIVSRASIERSKNQVRKVSILESARSLLAA